VIEVDGVRRPFPLLDRRFAGCLDVDVKGHRLRIDQAQLSRLGWTDVKPGHADSGEERYTLRSREPAPDDPALLAADVRALATSLIGEEIVIHVPMASPAVRATAARESAREDIAFAFGFLAFPVIPVSSVAAVLLGIATGWVAPLEAAIATGLLLLVSVLLFVGGSYGDRFLALLFRVVVGGTTDVAAWLAPVPVLGRLAWLVGMTLVLWFPVAVLAVVAVLL
jgi:hypothetical protein